MNLRAGRRCNDFKQMAGSVQPAAQVNGGTINGKVMHTERNENRSSTVDINDQKHIEKGSKRASKKEKKKDDNKKSCSVANTTSIAGKSQVDTKKSAKSTANGLANMEPKSKSTNTALSKNTRKIKAASLPTGKSSNPASVILDVTHKNGNVPKFNDTNKVKKKASATLQDDEAQKNSDVRGHNYTTTSEKKVKIYTARAESKGMSLDEYMNRRVMKKEKLAKKV